MSDKHDKDMVSYQQAYMAATSVLQRIFKDWPLGYPPNLVIHYNEPESARSDPRGDCEVMAMRARAFSYCDPSGYVPITAGVHVFQPNIMKVFRKNYGNNISHNALLFELMFELTHELFHLINLQRSYARIFDDYEDQTNERFSAELTIRQLTIALGSNYEERQTEQLAISSMIAWWFDRTKLSLDDLYAGKLMLPKANGAFFQQLKKRKHDENMFTTYEALTIIEDHYHLAEAAWNPDKEQRKYHLKKSDEMVRDIQIAAMEQGEKLGKTYDLVDEDM